MLEQLLTDSTSQTRVSLPARETSRALACRCFRIASSHVRAAFSEIFATKRRPAAAATARRHCSSLGYSRSPWARRAAALARCSRPACLRVRRQDRRREAARLGPCSKAGLKPKFASADVPLSGGQGRRHPRGHGLAGALPRHRSDILQQLRAGHAPAAERDVRCRARCSACWRGQRLSSNDERALKCS